jgi:hypothetical protein
LQAGQSQASGGSLWSDRPTLGTKDIWRAASSLPKLTTTAHDPKELDMFEELTEELLDLDANVRGFGAAVYAVSEDACSSGACSSCSILLCCTCTDLCW